MEQNIPTSRLPSMPAAASHNLQTPSNIIHDDDDDLFSNLDIDFLNTNVAASHPTDVNRFLDDDDDIFLEANIPDAPVTETRNNNENSNRIAFEDEDDDFDVMEIETGIQTEMQNEERRNLKRNNIEEPSESPPVRSVTENNEFFDPDLDAMFQSPYSTEDDFEKPSNEITDRNYEFKIAGCPLATILQLHSIDDNDKCERSFIVKCEIFKTVDQIRIVSNRYKLVVLIKDSSDLQLEVTFQSDFVS